MSSLAIDHPCLSVLLNLDSVSLSAELFPIFLSLLCFRQIESSSFLFLYFKKYIDKNVSTISLVSYL